MPFVLRDILKHGQKALKFKRVSAKLLNHGAPDLQAEQMAESASDQKTPQDGAIKQEAAPVAQPAPATVNITLNIGNFPLFKSAKMKKLASSMRKAA